LTIFDECLEALGKDKVVQSEDETREVFKSFTSIFPITKWGVIDWAMVPNKHMVSKLDDIIGVITAKKSSSDKRVFILWNDGSLPSIRVDLETTLRVIDDVTAVSFDTWLYSPDDMYVIEFHHEGRITIGFVQN